MIFVCECTRRYTYYMRDLDASKYAMLSIRCKSAVVSRRYQCMYIQFKLTSGAGLIIRITQKHPRKQTQYSPKLLVNVGCN